MAPTRETLAATRAHAPAIRTVSPMRVAGEVRTLLSCGHAATSVRMLWETGLLEHVAPAHAQYLAKSVNPDSTFVARTLAAGPLETHGVIAPNDEDGVEARPWERRRGGSAGAGGADAGGTGDGRHRRASKRVSDAATRRLFDRDPLFATLRALDSFATPSAPVGEELVFAALATPLAIRAVGWPRLPERVPESVKRAAGATLASSWRRLDAELATYDAWWRSLPSSERASVKTSKRQKFRLKTAESNAESNAWVEDWCVWSAAAASAQLALRDYSPSTRNVLFDSFALMHLPALTSSQRSAKDGQRRGRRERSNDGDVVFDVSDADFRKTMPPPLERLAQRLAEPARKAKNLIGVSLERSIRVRDSLRFLRVVLEAGRMCRGTEEEFDEGRYDGPDAVVDEDEPL